MSDMSIPTTTCPCEGKPRERAFVHHHPLFVRVVDRCEHCGTFVEGVFGKSGERPEHLPHARPGEWVWSEPEKSVDAIVEKRTQEAS